MPEGSGRVGNPRRAGSAPKPGLTKASHLLIHVHTQKIPIPNWQGRGHVFRNDGSLMHLSESGSTFLKMYLGIDCGESAFSEDIVFEPQKKKNEIFLKGSHHSTRPHQAPTTCTHKLQFQGESYSSDLLVRTDSGREGEGSKCL